MNLLGLTITRTKSLSLSPLSTSASMRGWWPIIRDSVAGAWQRNEEVRIDTALSNPTLYACITLIAGDIAKMRPKLVQKDDNGIWHEVESGAFSPFLRKPNDYQSRIDFFEWWMLSKLCHGNTYVLKARDGRGVPVQGHILDPTRVTPLLAPDGSVFYQLAQDDLAQIDESIIVPAREIIHDVMCPLFHPLVGVSPIYAAGFPAIQGMNIRNASDKFFSNGSKPGGVLTAPGSIAQATADRLKAYWESNFSGDNIGKIAVLGDGLHYEAMSMTADQSKLVEQLRMTDEDIAKCFHMPRHKVGVGPDPTFNNIEALNKQYYSDCLQKHIEKLEDKLDYGLELTNVTGKVMGVEFDRSALFEMDTTAKADAAQKAITSGMSVDEVRFRYHDLGPVPGGDKPFLQRQNWPLNLLGSDSKPPETTPAPSSIQPPEDTTGKVFAGLLMKSARDQALRNKAA
jgi:HK97 family phage portal protein